MAKTRAIVDIDSPAIRAFVKENTLVFNAALNGLAGASQSETLTKEENIGSLFRTAASFAYGICSAYGVSPEQFAELLHCFEEVKIEAPVAPKLVN